VKKLKGILVLVLLMALLASPIAVLASDVSGAKYYAHILVSNSGTATTNLLNGGYLNTQAHNCVLQSRAGTDLPFMPAANSSYPWGIWVPAITANGYLTDILYTANSTGGKIRYFPSDAGMKTTDDPSMELGDNFTITQSGWWDTNYSVNKTAVYKEDAFRTWISGTGNITSGIFQEARESPTGFSDPDAQWTNEPNAFDGNTATFAVDTVAAAKWSTSLHLTHSGVWTDNISYWTDSDNPLSITLLNLDAYYDGAWHDIFDGAPLHGQWTTANLTEVKWVTSANISGYNNGGVNREVRLNEFAFQGYIPTVSATGISSGEHVVKTECLPDVALDFDGVSDAVYCGTDSSLDFQSTENFTIEFWMKGDSSDIGALNMLVTRRATQGWVVRTEPVNGRLQVYVGSQGLSGNTVVMDDAWHLVHVVKDAKLGIYVDGNLDSTNPVYSGGSCNETGTGCFWAIHTDNASYPYKGLLDECRIYRRALGAAERTANFNAGRVGSPPPTNSANLEGHWHVDEGTGAVIDDETANANDGAIYGADWFDESLKIYVDDMVTAKDTSALGGNSVPNTSANWTFIQNRVMPYMENHTISVNGTQVQYIDWEYDDTTFSDNSSFGNDATPSFITGSSNANVTANMTGFWPVAEAQAPPFVLEEAPAFIDDDALTGNVTGSTGEFAITPPTTGFPLAGVIATIAGATSPVTPSQLPLVLLAGFTIIALSLAVSGIMRKYGSGSIFVKIIVIAGVTGVFIALGNFGIDFWMLLVFLIIGIALAMASRHLGWT